MLLTVRQFSPPKGRPIDLSFLDVVEMVTGRGAKGCKQVSVGGAKMTGGINNRYNGAFPGGSVLKNMPASAGAAGDMGLIPGLGRSPSVGKGNPLSILILI